VAGPRAAVVGALQQRRLRIFVSPHGLAFTNHHVGATCIQQLGTSGKDYIKTGFYAPTRAEEAKCPDLELNVLESMEDVTAKVTSAAKPEMNDAQAGLALRAAMAAVEKDCTAGTGLRCDVVTLYSGSVYHLYRYRNTPTCASCSLLNLTWHFSAAIPITSPIPGMTSISPSFAFMKMTIPSN